MERMVKLQWKKPFGHSIIAMIPACLGEADL
jgi:hypothetical protein